MSSDEYDAYLKSILEYNEAKAALDTAFYDGKLEGRIEGKLEGKIEGETAKAIEVARAMLAKGFAVDVIAEITKLTVQEVDALSS